MATSLTENINYLQPTGFKVILDRGNYGNVEFFAQSVNHPDVSINPTIQAHSRTPIPYPGDTINFSEITLQYMVDEDLTAYREIYNWMLRLVNEPYYTQYDRLKDDTIIPSVCQLSVIVLTSHNNKNITFKYVDAFPTSLGDISLEATNSTAEPIITPISFAYSYFIME